MPTTKHSTLTIAEALADFFTSFPGVYDVFLFGSVARNGQGEDIDLILGVEEDLATKFMGSLFLDPTSQTDWYWCSAAARLEAAKDALGFAFGPRRMEFDFRRDLEQVDLFLFPSNWLGRLHELQTTLPHSDPDFMRNIACDAKRYNAFTQEFDS